ncbi:MAG: ribonuclease P protein component [Anaerolineae bacterium]|nr:ribonuclease P protein component [Anaerolineae bacterium]
MLPRELRLRRAEDFERLRYEGKSFAGRMMVLSVTPNDAGFNRYGFIVSRRFGKAVQRNRARRLMREGLRLLHPRLVSGYDLALIARGGMQSQTLSGVLPELERLLKQAGLVVES